MALTKMQRLQLDGVTAERDRLRARVAELEARLAEEVMDRDHWKAFAESLDFPKPE